jgi:hypothetical protein
MNPDQKFPKPGAWANNWSLPSEPPTDCGTPTGCGETPKTEVHSKREPFPKPGAWAAGWDGSALREATG